jgi:signal transduction histidine kinase
MKENAVLFLDDEKNILASLKRLLRDETYEVLIASEFEEAMALLRSHPGISVVISDQRMPKVSGIEFLKTVKDEFPHIIRILFTGYSDLKAVEDAINIVSIYRFILKPWNDDELRTIIRQALEYHTLIQENARLLEVTRQQNEDLKKLDKLKSEFIANVSHELRTPLNSMNIVLSNIRRGIAGNFTEFPEKLQQYLGMIERNTENLRHIVDDLLDIFKLSDDGFSLHMTSCSLKTLLESEITTIAPQAEAHSVHLELHTGELPPMELDELRIRQVVRNLVANAIKFTPPDGRIGVTASSDGTSVNVQVADSGIGIEQKNLEIIFDRFVQVEEKVAGKPKGTGLGLAISKRIIDLHHGSIRAESIPGKGSTFIVTLPLPAAARST